MSNWSVRERIIQAAVVLVNATPPAGVPSCERTRTAPTEDAAAPALVCFPFDEEVEQHPRTGRFGPIVSRSFTLQLVAYGYGDVPDQALDPTLVWLTKCLGGQQFGGLAIQTTPKKYEWNYSNGNIKAGACAVAFLIEYQTLRNDETQVA